MNHKNCSIKKSLALITSLLLLIVTATIFYTSAYSAYAQYNEATNTYFQSAEKMLIYIQEAIKTMESATLFPSQLYTNDGDPYLNKTLREGSIYKNFKFYTYVDQRAKTALGNEIGYLAVYDRFGCGICSMRNGAYIMLDVDEESEWYRKMLEYHIGHYDLISDKDFLGSGNDDLDGSYLCLARTIIDVNSTFKAIGVCVAGIGTEHIISRYASYRMTPNQKFAIFKNGNLLVGTIDTEKYDLAAPVYTGGEENVETQQRKYDRSKEVVYNSIAYPNGFSIVIQTPIQDTIGNFTKLVPFYLISTNVVLILLLVFIISTLSKITKAIQHVTETCDTFVLGHELTEPTNIRNYPIEVRKMFHAFRHMSDRNNQLMTEILEKQKQKQELEIQLLRTQINPHYLYNTLEIMHLKAYTKGDTDVSNMAELLGKNLQYGLRNTTKAVTIREELHQLDCYLAILSYQYKERIQVHRFISEAVLDQKIIKLVFQPIVENSVIHGITSSEQELSIEIMSYQKNHDIVIQISDDGAGMNEETLAQLNRDIDDPGSNAIGLRNICRRIMLTYGQEYRPLIQSKEKIGTTITLHFPIQGEDKDDEYIID